MPSIINGIKDQVIQQGKMRFETDRFGVDIITQRVAIPGQLFPRAMLAHNAAHPRYPFMQLTRRSGEEDSPGMFVVQYQFEGFLFDVPEPVYELVGSLDQEPIAGNARFVSHIGGKPSAPLNGAIFVSPITGMPTSDDNEGVFYEFAATLPGVSAGERIRNPKAGQDTALIPGAEWVVSKFSRTRPSVLGNLGKIENPEGPNPSLSGRTWLRWAHGYVRRGGIYQEQIRWKISGPNGWDEDTYG